jgi:hypothetical protein
MTPSKKVLTKGDRITRPTFSRRGSGLPRKTSGKHETYHIGKKYYKKSYSLNQPTLANLRPASEKKKKHENVPH